MATAKKTLIVTQIAGGTGRKPGVAETLTGLGLGAVRRDALALQAPLRVSRLARVLERLR